ncbi:MAG TPA: Mur ligase family protein [Candidatus Hydrogenedentes bacterium]|nr:Mur ligase family protein [Candidatus Hydrogenedentota bacterium]
MNAFGSGRAHFSGIGGVAMVGGARLALELGWEVRGSDGPLYPPASDMVRALGIPVAEGYAEENLDWNPDVVVIGNALSRGNPEVEAALARRARFTSLPEWLRENLLRHRRPIVVTGTHGKTTTTAMTTWILRQAGVNPGWLIGGQPLGIDHPAAAGTTGGPFVIEGDEYDTAFFDKRAKFLHYLPEVAIVTSVEFDHGDIYRDLDEIDTAFQRLLRLIPRNGLLILCADTRAIQLREHAYSPVITYGFSPGSDWRLETASPAPDSTQAWFVNRGDRAEVTLRGLPPGKHNALNALAAIIAAERFGVSPQVAADALATFPGVRRRMECFLTYRNALFIDDFAHHPTAIVATLDAARGRWMGRRIHAVFEPRSNTTVTRRFAGELESALALADMVWLGPVYRAERLRPEVRLNPHELADGLRRRGIPARAFDEVPALADALWQAVEPGDIVLIMSNGAFGGLYDLLRQRAAEISR